LSYVSGSKGPSLSKKEQSDDAATVLEKTLNNQYRTENFNDFVNAQYNTGYPMKKFEIADTEIKEQGEAPASMINRYVLFQYKTFSGPIKIEDYRDNPGSRFITDDQFKMAMTPTTTNIINFFNDFPDNISMIYSYGDFIYCKYHGKIPNNYMLTLRRFHIPVLDDIISPSTYDYKSKQAVDGRQPDLARAVTWMSEVTGNKLEDIIQFKTELKFKEVESELQTLQSQANGVSGSGFLGIGTTGFSPASIINSVASVGSGTSTAGTLQNPGPSGFDPVKTTHPNFVEGPLYVIKRVMVKDSGIFCAPEFKVNFHYSLRSYGNINPKIAFLDILANMLVLTYNSAPFWGGGTRYYGGGTSAGNFGEPLGDHTLLNGGNLGEYLNSLVSDAAGLLSNVFGDGNGNVTLGSALEGAGKVASDMLGGWISKNFNSQQGAQAAQALLSGSPTGQWHLTVGNPLNPIAMIGNLICTNAEFKFGGPLGKDDFPTELTVGVTLKSGRDRDKADIEMMFNAGRGRLYQVPEGMEDYTNISGKQPTVITAYSKLPAPSASNNFQTTSSRSSGSGSQSSASNRGHNPAANNSGPDTIWGATGELYNEQVANIGAGSWLSSKFPNVSAEVSASLTNFSNAVNYQ